MAYVTTSDLAFAAGTLADLVGLTDSQTSTPDATVIAQMIALGQGEVDGYLVKQYAVPLAAPTTEIIAITARIAVYWRRVAKRMISEEDRKAYERDVVILEEYRDGRRFVGTDVQPQKTAARIDGVTLRPESKSVSRGRMRGFS